MNKSDAKPPTCDLCSSLAAATIHIPGGCTCLPYEYQRRCGQHLMRFSDTDPEFKVLEHYTRESGAEILDSLTTAELVRLKRDGIVMTPGGRIIRTMAGMEETFEKALKKAFKK